MTTSQRTIIVAFMAMLSALASAQDGLWVFAGPNLSTSSAQGAEWKLGGSVGALYGMQLSGDFSIQPRLMLSYQENEAEGTGLSPEPFMSQWNVCVPVLASWRIPLSTRLDVRVNAGPFAKFAVFGRNKQRVIGGEELGWWHEGFGDRLSLGIQGGLTVGRGRWLLTLDCRHSLGRKALNLGGYETTAMLGIGYRLGR